MQFDAHTDTWPDDDLTRVDHGTMFYKAVKEGIVDPARSVQVGIRTQNDDTLGVNIIDAREVHERGPVETAKKIKSILGDNKTYLTFDIDALDPAFAPGTGTPVWGGGLTSAQASMMLRDLAGINLVGGDIVEVSPPPSIPPVPPRSPGGPMWRWRSCACGAGPGVRGGDPAGGAGRVQ